MLLYVAKGILRWGDYPELLCRPNIITRVLINGGRREESQSQRFEDAAMLALKSEKGPTSQRTQVASRSWKAPLELPKGSQPC